MPRPTTATFGYAFRVLFPWWCTQGDEKVFGKRKENPGEKLKNLHDFAVGAAVIVRPPENQTVLENSEVRIPCEGQAEPANLTVRWYKDGIPYNKMANLEKKAKILSDGTLQIALITAEDSGWYTCEITNGIGKSITERAYINVECK